MTPADLNRMEADEALLPPSPWELWTSCSFRRIRGPRGESDVLSAYNQRSDNHPDLSMPEEQLFALVRLRNDLPALLARIRTLEGALDKAEVALAPFVQTYREFLKPNPFADQSSSTFKEFQAADEALTALRASREPLDHDGEG